MFTTASSLFLALKRLGLAGIVTLLLVNSAHPLPASASAGNLDLGFGANGIVTTEISPADDAALAAGLQSDGKLVVAGYCGIPCVVRYNSDGSLDTTFAFDASQENVVDIFGLSDLQILPNDQILLGGTIELLPVDQTPIILRLNADGSVDTTFGEAGVARLDFGRGGASLEEVAIQTDGSIASLSRMSLADFALARHTPTGQLDNSFGNQGVVIVENFLFATSARAITLQADGKILLAGSAIANNAYHIFVARYSVSGILDQSFGDNGVTLLNYAGFDTYGSDVAVRDTGEILVAGGAGFNFLLASFDTNGELNSGFGTQGVVAIDVDGTFNSGASALALQPDGKIILAGGISQFGAARFSATGALDTSFGNNGIVRTSIGNEYSGAKAIVLQPDQKLILAGMAFGQNGSEEFAVARYVADSAFSCSVLDSFDRRDGRIGSNWRGDVGGYSIRGQQVKVFGGGPIYWRKDKSNMYGSAQSACVTLTKIDQDGSEQGLVLKVQGNTPNWRRGAITVSYITEGEHKSIRVDTFQPGNRGPFEGWRHILEIPGALNDGDELGARALADGTVEVYRNGQLVGSVDTKPTNGSFFVNRGGRIGIWYINASDAIFDNFGDGDLIP